MRALTAQQSAALAAQPGHASSARVRVWNGAQWVNLSALGPPALDFLQEVEVSESVEAPVATATVRCAREVNGFSLAPLVASSPLNLVSGAYAPLLAEGRTFVVETAVRPLGMQPEEGDWLESFRGRIDSVDVGGEGLTFEGRDYGGGLLQDCYIETERQYGSATGTPAEYVMGAILLDNPSLNAPGVARWLPNHTYHDGDTVCPNGGQSTGLVYLGDALSGSTASSGSTEPSWPTTLAGSPSVDDGGMRWFATATHPILHTPVSPGWILGKFIQKGESLMDALSALAQQLGWEVRWKWNSSTSAFQLTFWSPDRAATAPVWTFTADEYQALGQVRTSLEDVRNAIEVVFSDTADLDVAGNPKRKTVLVEDATSIAAVGRRFMRMAEAATSNLNTSSEATTFANAAKADLKDTPLGLELEVDFHPDLELGDLVAVEGNGYHFTSTQTAAVRALTHTFNAGGASTKLTLLGKPSTSVRRWLAMEQRPATAPSSPFTGPSAPTGLSSATTAGGFRLSFSPPTTGPKAAAYELHVSTSSGFTPSDSTRRVVGALTEVVVTDLSPGTTYYAKVVARDAKGNRGLPSSEVTLTARYVEPRALQPRITWGALPLNGDFESQSDTAAPPDAWRLSSGAAWGTHAQLTTDVLSGKAALFFPSASITAFLTAQAFTVREGEAWVFSCFYKQSIAAGAVAGVLAFTYLDASLNAISAASVQLVASAANTWTRAAQRVVIPAGARFAEISVGHTSTATTPPYAGTLTVDSVDALRGVARGGTQYVSYQNGWADANLAVYGAVRFQVSDLGEVVWKGAAVASTPAPAAGANIFTLPGSSGARPADDARVFSAVTSGGALVRVQFNTTGTVTVSSIAAGDSFSLDGMRYFVD
ncbi:MAG: fibronectin type III domain-containing protein [Hyalangium sp.]|uniref:fibronectin type III domain-containing protein n=1 Tax=Hyalangium sp. TaxID=2028555 RepID=UPI00389A6A55